MRIESLSIKAVTVGIFLMIGIVAIILTLFAGSYFRQAALDAQMNSLSRVIEVAVDEVLKEVEAHAFELGMRLGHSAELVEAWNEADLEKRHDRLVAILDDPFINGFVGFSQLSLEKIRLFDLELELVAESSRGLEALDRELAATLVQQVKGRHGIERLKATDALWLSQEGPLYSTLVPVGGLHMLGYLEIVINPAMNLPDIGKITKTPVSVFSAEGQSIHRAQRAINNDLPVKYTVRTTDGQSAFRIVGYEDVSRLNQEMKTTQLVTTSGFLVMTLGVLVISLWLFRHFLLKPVDRMTTDMKQMAQGQLEREVNKKGLREFYILAEAFNSMADQVKARTNELRDSQSRLLHLLDLDNSPILCFDHDNSLVYFNKGASDFWGYSSDELYDLAFDDLFTDDIAQLLPPAGPQESGLQRSLHMPLECVVGNGATSRRDAVINTLTVMGESGYAVVLNSTAQAGDREVLIPAEQGEGTPDQGMKDVELSLKRIVEVVINNPGLLLGNDAVPGDTAQVQNGSTNKQCLRQQAVNVMNSALACWQHDLGKSKLSLAEESKIWPVYIDKSTPTTRTLDKYLHIDSCPRNPRTQRVVETAEFVLKQLDAQLTPHKKKLMDELQALRQSMSGV